jgi:hypothetical protein
MDAASTYSPQLSEVAVEHQNREFIADQVLPEVPVEQDTAKYLIWDKDAAYKEPDDTMSQDASPNFIDRRASQGTIQLVTRSLRAGIDDDELAQAGSPAAARVAKTNAVMNGLKLRKELRLAAVLRDTTIIANNTTLAGAAQWSDPGSDPGAEIASRQDSMPLAGNVFIAGRPVISKLRRHPKILDVTKYTTRGIVPMEALAEYLEVELILVGSALYDATPRGQTGTRQFVWGKDAILLRRPLNQTLTGADMMQIPSAGWTAYRRDKGRQWKAYETRDPNRGTGEGMTIIKVEGKYGFTIGNTDLVFLWKNAVA